LATIFIKDEEKRPIKLFFEDEARFGRINVVSRCWVPWGTRALVTKQLIREYTYAYTAVCPETGENYSIISPVNNTDAMNQFLIAFSNAYSHYRVIMCLDGAGWHTSKELALPENIRLLKLPPYSPELNPTEHIWDYIREQKQFNNHTFKTIGDVEDKLAVVLKDLNTDLHYISSLCNFSWLKSTS